jgi:hypothetical protein
MYCQILVKLGTSDLRVTVLSICELRDIHRGEDRTLLWT